MIKNNDHNINDDKDNNNNYKMNDNKSNDSNIQIIGSEIYFTGHINTQTSLKLFELMNIMEIELRNIESNEFLMIDGLIPIKIVLNSPGGYVTDSFGIYDKFKTYHRPIYIIIQGEACSGATLISCGADKVFMHRNSYYMVHELNSFAWGSYSDLKDDMILNTDMMEKIKGIYEGKTKLSREKINEILDRKTTWLNCFQAKDLGFIDEIIDIEQKEIK